MSKAENTILNDYMEYNMLVAMHDINHGGIPCNHSTYKRIMELYDKLKDIPENIEKELYKEVINK